MALEERVLQLTSAALRGLNEDDGAAASQAQAAELASLQVGSGAPGCGGVAFFSSQHKARYQCQDAFTLYRLLSISWHAPFMTAPPSLTQRRLALTESARAELASDLDALREENAALKDQLRAMFAAEAAREEEAGAAEAAGAAAAPVGQDRQGVPAVRTLPATEPEELKPAVSPLAAVASPRTPGSVFASAEGKADALPHLPEAIRALLPASLVVLDEDSGPALVESEAVASSVEGIFRLLRALRGQQAEQACRIREQQVSVSLRCRLGT